MLRYADRLVEKHRGASSADKVDAAAATAKKAKGKKA
jgi:hypothetical protein